MPIRQHWHGPLIFVDDPKGKGGLETTTRPISASVQRYSEHRTAPAPKRVDFCPPRPIRDIDVAHQRNTERARLLAFKFFGGEDKSRRR